MRLPMTPMATAYMKAKKSLKSTDKSMDAGNGSGSGTSNGYTIPKPTRPKKIMTSNAGRVTSATPSKKTKKLAPKYGVSEAAATYKKRMDATKKRKQL